MLILLAHERMAEPMRKPENPKAPNGINKERMAAVERVNIAAVLWEPGPPRGLHRSTHFQRQFVKIQFPLVHPDAPFEHEAAQLPVSGDVVEPVIVYAGVRKVLGHIGNYVAAGSLQQPRIAGELETKQRVTVLEALRPLSPAARRVAALDRDNRCAVCRIPALVELERFA